MRRSTQPFGSLTLLTSRLRVLACGLLLASALPAAAAEAGVPLRVVASFSILADMVREVGGPAVDVQSLVGPDADTHGFEPSPADARRLARADMVVINGLGFEGWMERLVKASGYRGPVVVATRGIPARSIGHQHIGRFAHGHEHGHGHGQGAGQTPDPHAWQDPGLAQIYVANLRDALIAARPEQAELFRERAAAYGAKLQALDAAVRASFDAIPRERRRVLTSHDAFGYFGAAYGVELLAARGISTAGEPSAAAVARLVDQVRRQRVRAIFVENISDPRLVERIAQESGAVVGGRLYSDALTAPGTEADTYLKLVAHNARLIASALSGSAPRP